MVISLRKTSKKARGTSTANKKTNGSGQKTKTSTGSADYRRTLVVKVKKLMSKIDEKDKIEIKDEISTSEVSSEISSSDSEVVDLKKNKKNGKIQKPSSTKIKESKGDHDSDIEPERIIIKNEEHTKYIVFDKNGKRIIDPRMDINISSRPPEVFNKPRKLSKNEKNKLQRLKKENVEIYKNHPDLKLQEDSIYEENHTLTFEPIKIPYLLTELMPHQVSGISWMQKREESGIKGGILADEMGLGKTLQIIGLVLLDEMEHINLIIVPSIALNQWIYEIKKHCPDAFNINCFYGRNKCEKFKFSNSKFNIIITTYGTVESEYRRKSNTLKSIKFRRIILDEAHIIKDNRCSTSKAISVLNSDRRWGLTGTPVQNRVNDLLSLIKFLRIDPHSYYFCKQCPCKSLSWLNYDQQSKVEGTHITSLRWCTCGHFSSSHFSWWNKRIANPIREFGQTEANLEFFGNLQQIIRQIILRRTKVSLEKSLGLPSKVVIVKRCCFSSQELEFYKGLYSETKSIFNAFSIQGQVLNNYGHIFELLQKMRMAVNHPYLTYKQTSLLSNIIVCGFCHEEADDPIRSKCNHIFCRKEAELFLMESNKCPVCRVPITIDLFSTEEIKADYVLSTENWQSSTKIETVVQLLNSFRTEGKSPKSIIFSQFVNFLEIIRWRLERAGFRCVKIYGSMTITQRQKAIDEFNSDPEITVFLISLKAGGVALNLTEAENVFIMDLWWNPAVEEQAMDRIHRIGQFRPIRIFKIVIEDSIESRVLTLQNKKKALFDTAINNDQNALQRLSEEDLEFLFC